ncbi:MAG: 30S ribosomal protein S5 [bacterium]
MADDTIMTPETEVQDAPVEAAPEAAVEAEAAATPEKTAVRGRAPRGRGGPGGQRRSNRLPRERGEFDSVNIDVRRVARVMAGGRRFNFSVAVVIGDKKGRVGVGLGKAADTALAIDKATRDAKKHMFTVPRTDSGSIRHEVQAKYASSTVAVIPSKGRGLVAGSAMRTVLELAGVSDVVTKILSRTKNKLTIARATVAALKKLRTRS